MRRRAKRSSGSRRCPAAAVPAKLADSPAPIARAATTSEGVDYSTGPGLSGTPASPSLFVLLILPLGLLVLEPVFECRPVGVVVALEGLPVRHGSAFKGPSFTQLLFGQSVSPTQVDPIQVGLFQVGLAQVGTAQIGTAQVGVGQVEEAQVGHTQVGSAKGNNGTGFGDQTRLVQEEENIPTTGAI